MKTIISLLLFALIAFLSLTNPTSEEFVSWYLQESLADLPDADFEQTCDMFAGHVRRRLDRRDYLFCSVFTYGGRTTLGIGLNFFPIDALGSQTELLRADYAAWLEHHMG